MSDRFQKAACVLLLILACCMCVIPGLAKPGPDSGTVCTASGRKPQLYSVPEPAGSISVNTDSAEELQDLPGIGETLSQFIVIERLSNGDYYYPEDLTAVKGIGMKKLELFRELLDFSEGGE